MIIVKETQGDTLVGVIDGVNTTYEASFTFSDVNRVNIYVNGRLKIRDWDDGFSVTMPNTVELNEALLVGDSLEVEYYSGRITGGGADGGCPCPPEIVILSPDTLAESDIPGLLADELEPCGFTDSLVSQVLSDDLRPVIVLSEEG